MTFDVDPTIVWGGRGPAASEIIAVLNLGGACLLFFFFPLIFQNNITSRETNN